KTFDKTVFKIASLNTYDFKYLKFFKPEFYTKIAGLLKERLILKDIITLVLQNSDRKQEILTEYKVKAIHFDDSQTFDFENEHDLKDGWLITDEGSK
ncbi:2302_t:CDS:1, partial [Cetraspora pellucida]